MVKYSPIQSIRLRNFMGWEKLDIEFDEGIPIIFLSGLSDAGKSAIIMGLAVVIYNHDYRLQKDFIRDFSSGFHNSIILADGTEVGRIKTADVNAYYIDSATIKWGIKKLDGSAVPRQIVDVLGIDIEPETGEYLHYRSYKDRTLFIDTPASTNHNVMYNALKVETLSLAIKSGSVEIAEIRKKIDKDSNIIESVRYQLDNIREVEIDHILRIRQRLKSKVGYIKILLEIQKIKGNLKVLTDKQASYSKLLGTVNVTAIAIIEKVIKTLMEVRYLSRCAQILSVATMYGKIDTKKLDAILNMLQYLRTIDILLRKQAIYEWVIKQPSLGLINTGILDILIKILVSGSDMAKATTQAKVLSKCTSLPYISTRLVSVLTDTVSILVDTRKLQDESQAVTTYQDEIVKKLVDIGDGVTQCVICGSYTPIIETGTITQLAHT